MATADEHKTSPYRVVGPPLRPSTEARLREACLVVLYGESIGRRIPLGSVTLSVGRAPTNELQLEEESVSRRHCELQPVYDHGEAGASGWRVVDLGSTNGTFVNGEKVKRARLKEGDRVLVGTSIARVESTDAPTGAGEAREAEARAKMQSVASRTTQVKTMTGTIDEVPLVDLLQLFATSKKSGVLAIQREDGTAGKIFLRKGQVPFASIDDQPDIPPAKAVYRMLTWVSGTFELLPPDEREFSEELSLSTEGLLMEGMRHLDESKRLESLLSATGRYTLPSPLVAPLKDLDAKSLTVLQHAWNHGRLAAIVDRSHLTDLDTMEILLRLVQQKYLKVEG